MLRVLLIILLVLFFLPELLVFSMLVFTKLALLFGGI
jgi:hypothetical protein